MSSILKLYYWSTLILNIQLDWQVCTLKKLWIKNYIYEITKVSFSEYRVTTQLNYVYLVKLNKFHSEFKEN